MVLRPAVKGAIEPRTLTRAIIEAACGNREPRNAVVLVNGVDGRGDGLRVAVEDRIAASLLQEVDDCYWGDAEGEAEDGAA